MAEKLDSGIYGNSVLQQRLGDGVLFHARDANPTQTKEALPWRFQTAQQQKHEDRSQQPGGLPHMFHSLPYSSAHILPCQDRQWQQSTIDHLRYFVHISICISNVNILADGACYYFILKENLESAKRERRMAIRVRETRIRGSKSLTFGEIHNGMPNATDNKEICVDTGFT